MSQREQLMKIADLIPEEQAARALLLLYRFLYEEAADDAFCITLNDAFVDNPDKGELIDFNDLCTELGIVV
ncbi:MAG: hypothetical protein FWD06_09740 [Oscillospiraceae bacterium]|nr:hypothetical protein [Oscillospiraceae bacterium]